MYHPRSQRHGRPAKRVRHIGLVVICLLLITAGLAGYHLYQNYPKLGSNKVVNRPAGATAAHNTAPVADTQHFDRPLFAFDVPAGWIFNGYTDTPYSVYSYHSQGSGNGSQSLDIYVDKFPAGLAANRFLVVYAQANRLIHDSVSANCVNLQAGVASGLAGQPNSPTQYSGAGFICDGLSPRSHVVSTSSPGNTNKVSLTSLAHGSHSFLFTYNDTAADPDFSPFYDVLESFSLK